MDSEAAKAKKKFLAKTLAHLNEALILVEGKRDAAALEEIGVTEVIEAAGRKPERVVFNALKRLKPRQKLVLLFDYDAEGERKTQEFTEMLCAEGVVPDVLQRKNFRRLLGARHVEESVAALNRLEQELSEKGE
ncbi:toprim domain-containing protein [Candidatus Micrarchaeota archaeon]|nr:toprim domain-containing protein [Candidatus Micrarchaeota archaeon]